VARTPDPDDRRSVVAVATPAGLEMLDGLHDRARDSLGRLYDRFDEQELQTLAELLERLVEGVDELADA
jgi:DNA-binding MarR family transcriptional regulator